MILNIPWSKREVLMWMGEGRIVVCDSENGRMRVFLEGRNISFFIW